VDDRNRIGYRSAKWGRLLTETDCPGFCSRDPQPPWLLPSKIWLVKKGRPSKRDKSNFGCPEVFRIEYGINDMNFSNALTAYCLVESGRRQSKKALTSREPGKASNHTLNQNDPRNPPKAGYGKRNQPRDKSNCTPHCVTSQLFSGTLMAPQ